jgi:hypothetical protein
VFPNAHYVMSTTEWDFWTSNTDLCRTVMNDHMKDLLVNRALKNLPPPEAAYGVA